MWRIRISLLLWLLLLLLCLAWALSAARDEKDPQQTNQTKKKKKKAALRFPFLPPPTIPEYHKGLSSSSAANTNEDDANQRAPKQRKSLRHRLHELLRGGRFAHNNNNNNNGYEFNPFYDPKLGFEMGVLATLSYWEFHKWSTVNATGFGLKQKEEDIVEENNNTPESPARLFSTTTIRNSHPITRSLSKSAQPTKSPKTKTPANRHYSLEYFFYNWHEPTGVKGVSFHDTDVLVSVSTFHNHNALVVAFRGTASVADAVTNVQTFEPSNHSGFFGDESEGSLHRGFLNAYSRVQRGGVLRLGSSTTTETNRTVPAQNEAHHAHNNNNNNNNDDDDFGILDALHRRFGHCSCERNPHNKPPIDAAAMASTDAATDDAKETTNHAATNDDSNNDNDDDSIRDDYSPGQNNNKNKDKTKNNTTAKKKKFHKKNRNCGCRVVNTNPKQQQQSQGDRHVPQVYLSKVLKELVTEALNNGHSVHITGHSLGGALASLLALDVLVNVPDDSSLNENPSATDQLYLWTFGAPQIADSLFLESVTSRSRRLQTFLGIVKDSSNNRLLSLFQGRLRGGRRRRRKRRNHSSHRKKRYHRYVTLSDQGKVDAVSEVAKNTLAAHKEEDSSSSHHKLFEHTDTLLEENDAILVEDEHPSKSDPPSSRHRSRNTRTDRNENEFDSSTSEKRTRRRKRWKGSNNMNTLHGKFAQSLGGVSRGARVTHFIEAHYLWTPDQHQRQKKLQIWREQQQQQQEQQQQRTEMGMTVDDDTKISDGITNTTTNTRSALAAHSMSNYLMGISREVGPRWHPLIPDVPAKWLEFMEIDAAISVFAPEGTTTGS